MSVSGTHLCLTSLNHRGEGPGAHEVHKHHGSGPGGHRLRAPAPLVSPKQAPETLPLRDKEWAAWGKVKTLSVGL